MQAAISGSGLRPAGGSSRGIAFAQPISREHHPLRGDRGDQPTQDQGRQGHHFETLARNRGDAFERLARQPADDVKERLGLAARNRVVMDDVKRVMRVLHMQPGNRAGGAADQVEALPELGAHRRRRRQHPVDRFGDGFGVAVELGQTQGAERQADPTTYPRAVAVAGDAGDARPDSHQLDAAAAEVADDAVRLRDAGEHPGG